MTLMCGEQPVLRGMILLSAVLLLGLGIVMATIGVGGMLSIISLELNKAAALLRVPIKLTQENVHFLFRTVALTGYGTVNVGAVAVCAVSGRRRVHSAAAAIGSGLAAFVYLAVLLGLIRPRIAVIGQSLDTALGVYFGAFQQTGDEKFLSQIHLQNGCCGLDNGPSDFDTWRRSLPSSCCGQFTGNCSRSRSRSLPCRTAIRQLSGSDGLFNIGYLAWLLGINCAVLCALLLLLMFSTGGETIEFLVSLRQKMEKWLRRRHGSRDGEKQFLDRYGGTGKGGGGAPKMDASKLAKRDQELRRVLQKSVSAAVAAATAAHGAAGARDRVLVQQLLEQDSRNRAGTSDKYADGFWSTRGFKGGPGNELEKKIAREIEIERLRLIDRMTHMTAPTESFQPQKLDSKTQPNKVLERKLRKEAAVEEMRTNAVIGKQGKGKLRENSPTQSDTDDLDEQNPR